MMILKVMLRFRIRWSKDQKSARRKRAILNGVFYTIIDLRDGSAIDRVTPDNKCIFFDACKKDEKRISYQAY